MPGDSALVLVINISRVARVLKDAATVVLFGALFWAMMFLAAV